MSDKSDWPELTMELTPCMEKAVRETFDLECEMLSSKIEKLPNGTTRYQLTCSPEKGELVLKFMLMIISKSNKLNLN